MSVLVRARAPLRLGLAGGGTDVSPYCDVYGGQVMNVTIDKYAYAVVKDGQKDQVTFQGIDVDISESHHCDDLKLDGGMRLAKGVYARIVRDFLGGRGRPVDVKTFSHAPPGSGLGSSSTMVVALVQAFAEFFQLPLGEYEVAHLAYEIERKDLGLAGGKQDQYAAAFGGFNFMEFYAEERVIVNPLRVKDWVWAELEASLVLYFTGVSRASADIIDQQSRNIGEQKQSSIDAMHRLKTEAVQMKESVLRGDLTAFGKTLMAGWEAKKQTADCITNPLIESVEQLAYANGARAAKVSGAGGGGFIMFVCDPEHRIPLVRALTSQGGSVMDFHFTQHGATSWRIS
ncbi:dehydrogenase [Dyella agri]|uniref:Dehydrogenase n=2 Tax=Dyella agri TaxID=1926869 RepID=A0ABW8KJB6_9GAMM